MCYYLLHLSIFISFLFHRGPKSVKNCANSDYSSLTDSQYLSGSQFWLENSQSFSQDISGQSRASQEV